MGGGLRLHSTARRKSLKFRLKLQLSEGVNLLTDVNMVTIRDILVVGYTLHHAETLLQTFSEFIGCAFNLLIPSVSRYFKKGNRLYHHPLLSKGASLFETSETQALPLLYSLPFLIETCFR